MAQLTICVVAPAVRRAGRRDAAAVAVTRADYGEGVTAGHRERCLRALARRRPGGAESRPQLPVAGKSPAIRRARRREAARVIDPGAHRPEADQLGGHAGGAGFPPAGRADALRSGGGGRVVTGVPGGSLLPAVAGPPTGSTQR